MAKRQRATRSSFWRIIDLLLVFWAYQAFTRGDYFRAGLYGLLGGGSLLYDFYLSSQAGQVQQQQRMDAMSYTKAGPSVKDYLEKPHLQEFADPTWRRNYQRLPLLQQRGLTNLLEEGNVDQKITVVSQLDNEFIFQGIVIHAKERAIRQEALRYIEDTDFLKFLALHDPEDNPKVLFQKINSINFKIDLLYLDNYRFKQEIIQSISEPKELFHLAKINLRGIISLSNERLLSLLNNITFQQHSYELVDLSIKQYDIDQSWDCIVYTRELSKNIPESLRVELVQSILNIPRFQDHPGYFAMIQELLQDVDAALLKSDIAKHLQRMFHVNSNSISLMKYLHDKIPEEFSHYDTIRLIEMLLSVDSEDRDFIQYLYKSLDEKSKITLQNDHEDKLRLLGITKN